VIDMEVWASDQMFRDTDVDFDVLPKGLQKVYDDMSNADRERFRYVPTEKRVFCYVVTEFVLLATIHCERTDAH